MDDELLKRLRVILDNQLYLHKRGWIEHTYGITAKDFVEMIAKQLGYCDCCGKDLSKVKRVCVDHKHCFDELGKVLKGRKADVRGIVCQGCNTAVRGIEHMRQIVAYLRKHGEEL